MSAFSTKVCVLLSVCGLDHGKMKQPQSRTFVYTIRVTSQLEIFQESDSRDWVKEIEGMGFYLRSPALQNLEEQFVIFRRGVRQVVRTVFYSLLKSMVKWINGYMTSRFSSSQ